MGYQLSSTKFCGMINAKGSLERSISGMVPGIFALPREEALIKLILKLERLRTQLLKELETVNPN